MRLEAAPTIWNARLGTYFSPIPKEILKMSKQQTYPKGFILNGVAAEIAKRDRLDMGIIYSAAPCEYSGVFTKNKVQASPVLICKERLNKPIHAVIANSGKANSFTGKQGMADAVQITELAEQGLSLSPGSSLTLSTGVIGEYLPMDRIKKGISKLCQQVKANESNPQAFAESIMTTDTRAKEMTLEVDIAGEKIRIYGSAKGSGMIFPNMATMLAFIVTDAAISNTMLNKALNDIIDDTFNAISVDGDMSTNDSVILLANGAANNRVIDQDNEDYQVFTKALKELALYLAQEIVRDGEGATKFIEIFVKGALSQEDARKCAAHLANSLLVKTAFFGEDANWGRFIYAIGASGSEVNEADIDIRLGDISLVKNGERTDFTDDDASNYMKNTELYLEIDLKLGDFSQKIYTCDLSCEYVRINAEYRS